MPGRGESRGLEISECGWMEELNNKLGNCEDKVRNTSKKTKTKGLEVLSSMHQTPNALKMELWAEACTETDLHMRGQKRFASVR